VKAFKVGGVDYITKPFQGEEVIARIDNQLTIQQLQKQLQSQNDLLRQEQNKSEDLLLNILPQSIVEQLKEKPDLIAEQYDEATFLFADIVGFTSFSAAMPPEEVVQLLNEIFSTFDQIVERQGLEKIRTIGDSYFVAGGLPIRRDDHAEAAAEMALQMQKAIADFQWSNGESIKLRVGINTGGPVVAAVIGIKKFAYDVWGDTVNIASRMESQGVPGKIQVTAATYEKLQDKYVFTERGTIAVRGKGEMTTYWLLGPKS
ncbi:MAG: adenylate/guanylate cyclase domain-containing protein, partial [Xenococcus sp. (in: cyanobacteria)]